MHRLVDLPFPIQRTLGGEERSSLVRWYDAAMAKKRTRCRHKEVPPINSQIITLGCQNRLINRTKLRDHQAFRLLHATGHFRMEIFNGQFRRGIESPFDSVVAKQIEGTMTLLAYDGPRRLQAQ